MKRRIWGGLLAVVVVLFASHEGAGHSWQPAQAAFPGANGKFVFTSDRDGKHAIYVMNADGSGVTRLTFSPDDDFQPAWSPDGSRIAFVGGTDVKIGIFAVNADGGGVTLLAANAVEPAW
jgi:TolB protein